MESLYNGTIDVELIELKEMQDAKENYKSEQQSETNSCVTF